MGENKQSKSYFNEDKLDKNNLFVEIPDEPTPPYQERVPSGYDPMGEIYLRGRAFRGLAEGRIRWWILISGWIIFGGFALLILSMAVTSSSWAALIYLAILAIPLLILCRGTQAKLSSRKHKRR